MSTGKTLLALALSTLLPASAAWAANNDTIIYCSEASPESFNPQIASSGPSFVASSQVLYNRLINFDPVKIPRFRRWRSHGPFPGRQDLYLYAA
jgi:ABC-type transport system substrate-binding protein